MARPPVAAAGRTPEAGTTTDGPASARSVGPPFLRLDARTSWRLGASAFPPADVVVEDGALALGRPGTESVPRAEPFGTFGGRTLPRGLAVTPDGWLLLAHPERREVLATQLGNPLPADGVRVLSPLWPARPLRPPPAPPDLPPDDLASPGGRAPEDPYALVRPTDVTVAPTGDVVVADAGAGRVLVLAWPSGVLRHVVAVPGGAPTAVAFDAAGRAHVADPALGTVHRYDPRWRRDPGYPHPGSALTAPEHVAGVRDPGPAHVLVLDARAVVALDARGRRVPLAGRPGLHAVGAPLPDLAPGPLQRAEDGSPFWRDEARPRLDPVPLTGLPLTGDGRHRPTGRPLLALPRRVRRPRAGMLTTASLDGERPGFAWDRVVLAADLPSRTRVLLRTLTSDSPLEPDRVQALPDTAWAAPLALHPGDTPDALVQSPGGRYLWLRLELFGDGTATPHVHRIDVHGPRRSSLRHLPASFRTDPESVRFLDRFLSYFDTVLAEVVTAHRDLAALFDPQAVPAGPALDWLGSWFDLHFLAEWPPAVRRRMVAEAAAAARTRGTISGLRRVVQHHTGLVDPLPQVVEHFHLDPAQPPPVGGAPLDAPGAPHTCTLVLPRAVVPSEPARERLAALVAGHTPAHVRVHLRVVDAGVAVGRQATVGVDALLGPRSRGALGEGALGGDLVTAGPRPHGPVPALPLPRSTP